LIYRCAKVQPSVPNMLTINYLYSQRKGVI